MPHMEGIFINGEKAKFHPEDILDTNASQYTEEIGESVTAYLTEHITNPSNPPIDTSLSIAGAAADAKKTGDEISELKEDTTQLKNTLSDVENYVGDVSEEKVEYISLTFEDTTGFWDYNVDRFVDYSELQMQRASVSVQPYDEYVLTAYSFYNMGFVAFLDGGGELISIVDGKFNEVLYTNISIVVPSGAVTMLVQSVKRRVANAILYKKTGYASTITDQKINHTGIALNDIINNGFSPQYTTENLSFETVDGYYDKSGNFLAFGAADGAEVPAKYGERYLLTSKSAHGMARAAFLASDKKVIGTVWNSNDQELYVDTEIIVPQGTTTMVVQKYRSDTTNIMLKKLSGYTPNVNLPWADKKWVVIGDSLTEENIRTNKHYFDYISEETGINVVNMGKSGTGYKNGGETYAFYTRVRSVPTDADVITIFGSFNDGLTDLGTPTDTGTTTIGGCINTTLDNLFSVYPLAQVGIVSPTPWQYANPYDAVNYNAYVELLEAICKRRSLPFLNLYYESGLRPWSEEFRNLAYTKDEGHGVHPDETGHKLIAPRFKGFLETLLL